MPNVRDNALHLKNNAKPYLAKTRTKRTYYSAKIPIHKKPQECHLKKLKTYDAYFFFTATQMD